MAKEDNPKIISKKHLARLEKEKIQNRIHYDHLHCSSGSRRGDCRIWNP